MDYILWPIKLLYLLLAGPNSNMGEKKVSKKIGNFPETYKLHIGISVFSPVLPYGSYVTRKWQNSGKI